MTHTSFQKKNGFALVVTLSLMVLLAVVAVGLLSLSSVALRSSTLGEANATARGNARMALVLALGELQAYAGDDRRITADGDIIDGATHPHAVGVWESWSPRLTEQPTGRADYGEKDDRFIKWLASNPDTEAMQDRDWISSGTFAEEIELFAEETDGFDLSASKIEVTGSQGKPGAMAWVVSQAATKAKINIAGPEEGVMAANDALQAQPRPSLEQSGFFGQPDKDHNLRASRVIDFSQAKLDTDLWQGPPSIQGGAHFTTQGMGLLTDVVNGGLKTDLNLGFEMSDSEFRQDSWGSIDNPFRAKSAPNIDTPSSYSGERPLFEPLTNSASVGTSLTFEPANVRYEFPNAAVPTFDTLRSFYRTPYHLYNTPDGPTVFERGDDHVAVKQPRPKRGEFYSPGGTPPGISTHTGYRPVLDRILFLVGVGLETGTANLRLTMTPIITLWNPYNAALEIEGAVAYPWIDVPFNTSWQIFDSRGTSKKSFGSGLSQKMGHQLRGFGGHGRSVDPYFYATITADGNGNAGSPIRFQPGEVRVFAPSSNQPKEFAANGNDRARSIFLQPVDNPNQLSSRGGLSIPPDRNVARNTGQEHTLGRSDSVSMRFNPSGDRNNDYPFFISLEDAARTKMASNYTSSTSNRPIGRMINDVQTINFITSGATTSMQSPRFSYSQIVKEPQIFGLIETYHRVASDSSNARKSDLVYTANPRQPFINRFLTTGSFKAGPHYETRMRQISSLGDVLQTYNGGRNAFYGETNGSNTGRTHLSFFEVPREPMLSLAGFQHADLSSTAFATAYQVGNSWAPPYLRRQMAAELSRTTRGGGGGNTFSRESMPIYDTSFLSNEALWDSFYFSGAAPTLQPGSSGGSPNVWENEIAQVSRSLKNQVTDFVRDPVENPLRNTRMRLHRGGLNEDEILNRLLTPEGCVHISSHLMVDGAFNVNSTSTQAWTAFLSGLRGHEFDVENGNAPANDQTAFPRLRTPFGDDSDPWQGFSSLSDPQIKELADNIVQQVRERGPFLSLAEFVNRQAQSNDLSYSGALQTAIDATDINSEILYDTFDTSGYPRSGKSNIRTARTGVGIPGYLTQADVLQSIAPVITTRSDTFTVRGYGEAHDKSGRVIASATCEAIVQRTPEFVDGTEPPHTMPDDLNPINELFGRRFSVVSFRYLSKSEIGV